MKNIFVKSVIKCESDFLRCGVFGWCLEVIFTGLHNLQKHDKKMLAHTSLLMFPIYGLAVFINPIHRLIQKKNIAVRGFVYTCLIFITEFVSGSFLKKKGMCPWDYSKCRYNIKGIIRLDYAPAWFIVGLLYEKLLSKKSLNTVDVRSHTYK